jgi:hypothetical protein
MKSDDCELKDECMEFLCDFPDRVPHRCRLCTPMVKYTLERLKAMHDDEHATLTTPPACATPPAHTSWWWNNGLCDE